MKILLSLTCSNRDADSAASFGLVELTKAEAAGLVSLHQKGRAFLEEVAKEGTTATYFPLSVGLTGYPFRALRYTDALSALISGGSEGRLAVLADDADIQADGDDGEERVECFRVRLREESIQLTALSKHGDYSFSAEDIPLALLKQAAA